MTAKKILRIASFAVFIAIALPANAGNIVPATYQSNSAPATEDHRVQQLVQRLQEIRNMNKSELTRAEKRDLRKEVKEIRKEMKSSSKGVYLSVGAIIIIILLLILIL